MEIKKCPDCMAHYTGEHSCPPWLKTLFKRHKDRNQPTPESKDRDYAKEMLYHMDSLPKRTGDELTCVSQLTPESKDRQGFAIQKDGAITTESKESWEEEIRKILTINPTESHEFIIATKEQIEAILNLIRSEKEKSEVSIKRYLGISKIEYETVYDRGYNEATRRAMSEWIPQAKEEGYRKGFEDGENLATPQYKKDMQDAFKDGKDTGLEYMQNYADKAYNQAKEELKKEIAKELLDRALEMESGKANNMPEDWNEALQQSANKIRAFIKSYLNKN